MTLENELEIAQKKANMAGNRLAKSILVSAPILIAAVYEGTQQAKAVSQENLTAVQNIVSMMNYGAIGGALFGSYAMVKSKLFGTDGRKGGSLVTDGAFKLCRNPYYFGMGSAMGLMAGLSVMMDEISREPTHIPAILTAVGIGILGKGLHDYVKTDEKLLELKFGDDYVKYKKRTPRYLPNPLRLLRDNILLDD